MSDFNTSDVINTNIQLVHVFIVHSCSYLCIGTTGVNSLQENDLYLGKVGVYLNTYLKSTPNAMEDCLEDIWN